jgi:hypothetical protein
MTRCLGTLARAVAVGCRRGFRLGYRLGRDRAQAQAVLAQLPGGARQLHRLP